MVGKVNEENPNYFAIIPASVRYDKSLSATSKLFYGEITALANKTGCCWASNKYFSELYAISERQVTRIISELEKNGYIEIEFIKKGVLVERRNIYLIDKNVATDRQKCQPLIDKNVQKPIDKNVGENNTSNINNTRNNNKKNSEKKPTLEEIKKYCEEKKLSVDANYFFTYFEEGEWIDSKGNKVKNWKQKILTWDRFNNPTPKKEPAKNYVTYTNNEKVDISECPF